MPVVNLGNDQLNINTTTAKGLEKVIGVIAKFVIDAQVSTNLILYGGGGGNSKIKGIEKITERGIIGVLEDISDVDFCNLLNYVASRGNPKKNSFNPNGPREGSTPFQKKLWVVQNTAFKMQQKIDEYYSLYGTSIGQDSRIGLLELLNSVNLNIESLLSPSIGINEPEILKQFPQVSVATNYLNNALLKLSSYTTFSVEIPTNDVAKILKFIDRIRLICGVITSLDSAALIGTTNALLRGKLQEDFNKINKFITPGPKVIALLKDIIKNVTSVNNAAKKILGFVDTARGLIRIAIFLIKIFNILKTFLLVLPLPGMFTTAGITTTFSKVYNQVLEEEGTKKLIKRLNQVNLVLNLIVIFITSLIAALDQIIKALTAILLNIQSCNYGDAVGDLDLLSRTDLELGFRGDLLLDGGSISGGGVGGDGLGLEGTDGTIRGAGGAGTAGNNVGITQAIALQTGTGVGPGSGGARTASRTIDRGIQNGIDRNPLRGLALELQSLINDLTNTRNRLKAFIDGYNRNKNLVNKTFFGYTIEIATEELADEGIRIRRRYGVARSPENKIVVETTPTFASLDLIIINEVKSLLVSRGYVDLGLGTNGIPSSLALKAKNAFAKKSSERGTNPADFGIKPLTSNPSAFSGTGNPGISIAGQGRATGNGLAGSADGQRAAGGTEDLDAPIGSRPGDLIDDGLGSSTDAISSGATDTDVVDTLPSGTDIGATLGVLSAEQAQVVIESLNYLDDPNVTLSAIDVSPSDFSGGSFGADFGGELTDEQEDEVVDELQDNSDVSKDVSDFVDSVPKGKKLRRKVKKKLKKAIRRLIKKIKNTDPSSKYGSGNIVTDIIPKGFK